MRKIQNAISDAIDVDIAIEDLAKSKKIAMNGMTLRAQLETTIANAEMVTRAAEFLRDTARKDDRNQASLVPRMPATSPKQQDTWIRPVPGGSYGEIDAAGDSFERKVGTPILELFDQLGGFVKRS